MLLKVTSRMKNLDIFYHCYLLNADDKTFYERHFKTENTVHKFHTYSIFLV